MNDEYKHARQHAEQLHRRFSDLLDDRNNPNAASLLRDTRQLEELFEQNKTPRTIEDFVKRIIHSLEHMRSEGDQAMDFRHIDSFIKEYEHFQMSLRRFSNY
jgi:hypothetical protein